MFEADWNDSRDPVPMLNFVRDRTTTRKLRLFACACLRRLGILPMAYPDRRLLKMAELHADGQIGDQRFFREEWKWGWSSDRSSAVSSLNWRASPHELAWRACLEAQTNLGEAERIPQAALLRDLIRPFDPPPRIERAWLDADGRRVWHLAATIYDQHRFDDLPFLGDALEEAGCTDEMVLNHCREPGLHARGCWVLDALLGRE
jgi:hypothetical protein